MHPEAGHVPVQPLPGDAFGGYSWGKGCSPFNGVNTVEGLACSVALTERLQYMNKSGSEDLSRGVLAELPDDHEVWDHAANALANLCATLLLTLSMEKIVFGGGIMQRNGLLDKIRSRTKQILNGYLDLPDDMGFITLPTFGPDAGLVGTMVLAHEALLASNHGESKHTKPRETTHEFRAGLRGGLLAGVAATTLLFMYAGQRKYE